MSKEVKDVIASIYNRLKNLARQNRMDFQTTLQYYGMERFLFRLSQTGYQKNFVLKGGLLLNSLELPFRRVTKDIDFRGFTQNSLGNIEKIFREVSLQECPEDGLRFDPDTLTLEPTQVNAEYDGIRANLIGYLGRSKIFIQIDIGFLDEISPNPIEIDYPCFLSDLPVPKLRGYPPETVIAEKVHAILRLGELNSRLKDFYDIWLLSEYINFAGIPFQEAIRRTFERRQTDIPTIFPKELMIEFARNHQREWERTIIRPNRLIGRQEEDFEFVVDRIICLTDPPIRALARNELFASHWCAGEDWTDAE